MDRKIVMGVAAVAGIGLLLYMRKSGDQATLAGTPISSGISNWASQPIVINATTKPQAVVDTNTKTPAPAPMPEPAKSPAQVATWGGGSNQSGSGALGGGLNSKGEWVYADGSIYKGPSVTDRQAMSILGY